MEKKKFRLADVILSVICVVFVAEAAAPVVRAVIASLNCCFAMWAPICFKVTVKRSRRWNLRAS